MQDGHVSGLADDVAARVRQDPLAAAVPGSTPVLAFGNVRSARTATLGLNPSRLEFLDARGAELTGPQRRLETLRSLGVASLADADGEIIDRVVAGCDDYFKRAPYRRWFDQLDYVLGALGDSYYGGTACHLDLVQPATDPVWGGQGSL